jgi:hypothetical protein
MHRKRNLNTDEKLKCEKTSICKLRKNGSWFYKYTMFCTKQLIFSPLVVMLLVLINASGVPYKSSKPR